MELLLSIESSCDDSSIAVTEIGTKKLIYHKKISQDSEHSEYGGVVPELASRLHAVALPKILEECKEYLPALKGIAVTNAPGLNVTLLEGVMLAKALAVSLDLPIVAVNHLEAHIYSLWIEEESFAPVSVLLVSGGHSMILEYYGYKNIKLIGESMDDSFGESFDKCAKMLSLGYPGGPIVQAYAQDGDDARFAFTVPLSGKKEIEFSFSGLKNAVRMEIEKLGEDLSEQDKKDICASFQKSAVKHIIDKCKLYLESKKIERFAMVGGASANLRLRGEFESLCKRYGTLPSYAPLRFTADNAAMVGRCGCEGFSCGDFTHFLELSTSPRIKFTN